MSPFVVYVYYLMLNMMFSQVGPDILDCVITLCWLNCFAKSAKI